MSPERENPFVGPRAIKTGEPLYGRERETAQLANLLIAERIVLLYSPSGAGKTSLIQAALIPRLQSRKFNILATTRVNLEPPPGTSEEPGFNRYVFSVLSSLEEDQPEDQRLDVTTLSAMRLSEYLERFQDPALVLVFDQFEEILTINPADQGAKHEFFEQVGEALSVRNRWALFSMREDYIAALEPYLLPIPTRLNNTYRLDLLDKNSAGRVIQKTASLENVDFTEAAVDKLLGDLCRVMVQRPDGSFDIQPGQYVEPVQLQVVCYNLWQRLDPEAKQVTEAEIETIGDVDNSLAEYYSDQVAVIAARSSPSERSIREWFERKLITEGGIRGQVLMSAVRSQGLENEAIHLLENAHLVRRDTRRGVTWFELSHDRLIGPIRRNNAKWFEINLSLLQRRAALWESENRPENLLLRQQELAEAETWAADHPDELSELDRDFLVACQEARQREIEERELQEKAIKLQEQQRIARLLRTLLIFAVMAALVAGVFGIFAYLGQNAARKNEIIAGQERSTAEAASTLAFDNAATAQAASNLANENALIAEANAATAQAAQGAAVIDRDAAIAAEARANAAQATAEFNAEQASIQASLATSRRLASQAMGYLNTQPDLTALLGVEAFRSADTQEAKTALLARVQTSLDQTITEYDVPIPSQNNDILTVSMSPDGEHLAWGDADGNVAIWNYQDRRINRLGTHSQPVRSVAYSPDGNYLASGGEDAHLYIWDLNTGQQLQLKGVVNLVMSTAFSPNGNLLAASVGSQVSIWDVAACIGGENCYPIRNLTGRHTGLVRSIAWSPDGNRLASGSGDRRVVVWDVNNGGSLLSYREHTDNIYTVAWSPDGDLLASGGADRMLILWDIPSNQAVTEPLQLHGDHSVYGLAFSSDGEILASAGGDGEVSFLDTQTLQEIGREQDFHDFGVTSVDFSPVEGERLLATGCFGNTIGLFEITPQQPLSEALFNVPGEILSVANLPSGGISLVERRNGTINLWDPDQDPEKPLHSLITSAASAAISMDGSLVALGHVDGEISLVEFASGEELNSFSTGDTPVLALAFSPDGRTLVSSQCVEEFVDRGNNPQCSRHDILFWDYGKGEVINTIEVDQETVDVVQEADIFGHSDYIRALAINPSGQNLVTGSDDKTIMLWNIQSKQPVAVPLAGHDAAVTSLAFSPDSATLASAGKDRKLLLWDTSTLQSIGDGLVGSPAMVSGLGFSPDNKTLLAGDIAGTLTAWNVDNDSWVARNCELAGRNLSDSEWDQFFPDQRGGNRPTCP